MPQATAQNKIVTADGILKTITTASALVVVLMLVGLLIVLAHASMPSIRAFGLSFVTSREWRPNELEQPKHGPDGKLVFDADGELVTETIPAAFGALPVIYGTIVSSILALVFAVPLSLGAALFLVRIVRPWIAAPVSFLVEFLAAIPSIAYGIWGLFVLCPFLRDHVLPSLNSSGRNMLSGGVLLGIMIVPIITAISRDILRNVPRTQVEGTVALGATWWESSKEMLKFSRSGLFGAAMLGLARAAGETMAITMVIGNSNQIKASLLAPAQTMSSLLANEFAEASTDLHRAALTEVALILLLMSLLFNVVARYLVVGQKFPHGGSSLIMAQSRHNSFAAVKSRIMYGICVLSTLFILSLLTIVAGYLISIGVHSLSWSFFRLDPIAEGMAGAPGGMRNALVGTLILIGMASLVGIPIGMLTGIYLSEYSVGSYLAAPVRFIADVLAGVPSIVVGILGYELVVRPMGNYNGYAGGLALAFIMIPIIARTTEEMLLLVPNSYREASIALGSTKAGTILKVVIPTATGSLVTGVMLAIARVAGETAPLLFTALGSRLLTTDPRQPFPSLTVQIFTYATGPYKAQRDLAWSGILVLITLIFVLNLGIRFVTRTRK